MLHGWTYVHIRASIRARKFLLPAGSGVLRPCCQQVAGCTSTYGSLYSSLLRSSALLRFALPASNAPLYARVYVFCMYTRACIGAGMYVCVCIRYIGASYTHVWRTRRFGDNRLYCRTCTIGSDLGECCGVVRTRRAEERKRWIRGWKGALSNFRFASDTSWYFVQRVIESADFRINAN